MFIVFKSYFFVEKDWIDLIEMVDYLYIVFLKKSGLCLIIDDLFRKIGVDY